MPKKNRAESSSIESVRREIQSVLDRICELPGEAILETIIMVSGSNVLAEIERGVYLGIKARRPDLVFSEDDVKRAAERLAEQGQLLQVGTNASGIPIYRVAVAQ